MSLAHIWRLLLIYFKNKIMRKHIHFTKVFTELNIHSFFQYLREWS